MQPNIRYSVECVSCDCACDIVIFDDDVQPELCPFCGSDISDELVRSDKEDD